jgi:hypothetical protein
LADKQVPNAMVQEGISNLFSLPVLKYGHTQAKREDSKRTISCIPPAFRKIYILRRRVRAYMYE